MSGHADCNFHHYTAFAVAKQDLISAPSAFPFPMSLVHALYDGIFLLSIHVWFQPLLIDGQDHPATAGPLFAHRPGNHGHFIDDHCVGYRGGYSAGWQKR